MTPREALAYFDGPDALPRLASTRRSRARLPLLRFRGIATAARVCDDIPVTDVLRRIVRP